MNPHESADKRVELSAEYSRASEELADVLEFKTSQWLVLREKVKSDKSADRLWEATQSGVKEMRLRLKLKALEKEMSAIRTMLDVWNGEARNQY